jgi:PAS domain S-box-containing protein
MWSPQINRLEDRLNELEELNGSQDFAEEKIDVLLRLSTLYSDTSPERSIQYSNRVLELTANNPERGFQRSRSEAAALTCIGNAYTHLGVYKKAHECFLQSLRVSESIRDEKAVADTVLKLGRIFWSIGQYDSALENGFRAMKLHEELHQEDGVASCLVLIGSVWRKLANPDTALDHYRHALEIYRALDRKAELAQTENQIGRIHTETGRPELALECFIRTLQVQEEMGDQRGIANTFENIGRVYLTLKNVDKALQYLKESLRLRELIANGRGIADCHIQLGSAYELAGDYDEAWRHLESGIKLADEIGARDLLLEGYRNHAQLLTSMGDSHYAANRLREACLAYQRAIEYRQSAGRVQEMIFNEEQARKVTALQTIYETERKEKEKEIYRLRSIELVKANEALRQTNEIVRRQNDQIVRQSRDLDRTLQHLRESEAKLRAIFENAEVGIVMWDLDDRFLFGNAKFAQMTGLSPDHLLSHRGSEVIHSLDRDEYLSSMERIRSGEQHEIHAQFRIVRKDGTSMWCNLSASGLNDSSGDIESLIGILIDVDAQMHVQQDLIDSYLELKRKNEEIASLEQKNVALAMAVTTNHEINQPLMVLSGNLEILQMVTEVTSSNEKYFTRIFESVEKIRAILAKYRNPKGVSIERYLDNTPMLVFEEGSESGEET